MLSSAASFVARKYRPFVIPAISGSSSSSMWTGRFAYWYPPNIPRAMGIGATPSLPTPIV